MLKSTVMIIAGAAVIGASVATANEISFATPIGSSTAGGLVSGSATFTTGTGSLSISLNNLFSNLTDAGQLISGLEFQLGGVSVTPALSSSSGQEITISGLAGTAGATLAAGWGFGALSPGFIVCVICPAGLAQPPSAGPDHTIIGPGPYTNANSSVNGNVAHNPFLNHSATFTITSSQITPSTAVSGVKFTFGTSFGDANTVVPSIQVPEPTMVVMVGGGLLLIWAGRIKGNGLWRMARSGTSRAAGQLKRRVSG